MNDLYKTIKSVSKGLFKDKGSKFIAFAYPVKNEDEINLHLATLKKKYHDARHNCFAWRLGADKERYRINDDGEPSGSAGNPIYGQLQKRDLSDVLVVVIRYFGGTLLGIGGLMNAYRSAASDALDHSEIIDVKVYSKISLEFGYAQMDPVMRNVKKYQLIIDNQQFDLECKLTVRVWKRDEKRVVEKFGIIEGCSIVDI